jgi:hypothetical protein
MAGLEVRVWCPETILLSPGPFLMGYSPELPEQAGGSDA